MVKQFFYQRVYRQYKFTELHYSTQIVNNSIKFKTIYPDITTYKCRIQFDAFAFHNIFILFDPSVTFENIHFQNFEDFLQRRRHFYIFQEFSKIQIEEFI